MTSPEAGTSTAPMAPSRAASLAELPAGDQGPGGALRR